MSQAQAVAAYSAFDLEDQTVTLKETRSKTWTLSWNFDADFGGLNDINVRSEAPLNVDWGGQWHYFVHHRPTGKAGQTCLVGLEYDGASIGCLSSAPTSIHFHAIDVPRRRSKGAAGGVTTVHLSSAHQPLVKGLPALNSGSSLLHQFNLSEAAQDDGVDLDTHRRWRITLTITVNNAAAIQRPLLAKSAMALQPNLLTRLPANTRFLFPDRSLELWSTSDILTKASPHLKSLLASAGEDVKPKVGNKRRKSEGPSSATELQLELDGDFNDSDDEGDDIYCGVSGDQAPDPLALAPPRQLTEQSDDSPFTTITIPRGISFTTLRAVITHITTSHIDFAPLSSSISTTSLTAPSRRTLLRSFADANPDLPLPASPKSVFRLAKLLGLKDLQELALASFGAQLGKDTVAKELFSVEAAQYEELRTVVVDQAAKSWAEVKGSAGLKEVQEAMKTDEALALRFAKVMSDLILRV